MGIGTVGAIRDMGTDGDWEMRESRVCPYAPMPRCLAYVPHVPIRRVRCPRAFPLRGVRSFRRHDVSAGLASQQGACGGLRAPVRERRRIHRLARSAAQRAGRTGPQSRRLADSPSEAGGRRNHLGIRRARHQDGALADPHRLDETRLRVGARHQRRRHHPRLRGGGRRRDVGRRRRDTWSRSLRHGRGDRPRSQRRDHTGRDGRSRPRPGRGRAIFAAHRQRTCR